MRQIPCNPMALVPGRERGTRSVSEFGFGVSLAEGG